MGIAATTIVAAKATVVPESAMGRRNKTERVVRGRRGATIAEPCVKIEMSDRGRGIFRKRFMGASCAS